MCGLHSFPALLVGLSVLLGLLAAPAWGGKPAKVLLQVTRGPGSGFRAEARVLDAAGEPVPGTSVGFKVRTTFGWLSLGTFKTDGQGVAWAELPGTAPPWGVRVEAGDEPQVATELQAGGRPPGPRVRPGREVLRALSPQPGVISPYLLPEQVAVLGILLGGIWATYGYVGWRLWRMRARG